MWKSIKELDSLMEKLKKLSNRIEKQKHKILSEKTESPSEDMNIKELGKWRSYEIYQLLRKAWDVGICFKENSISFLKQGEDEWERFEIFIDLTKNYTKIKVNIPWEDELVIEWTYEEAIEKIDGVNNFHEGILELL